MKTDSLLLRGELHEVYGEDAQFFTDLGDDWWVAAVMDGCSSGKESHFAAALMVKILRKSCKTMPLLAEINPDLSLDSLSPVMLGEFILNQVFDDLKRTRKMFMTDRLELLSTLILLVYHKPTRDAYICVSGDGFIKINDEFTDIDQHNMPDYMAYNMELPFDKWLAEHTRTFKYENVNSAIISTDGIQKFFDKNRRPSKKVDPVEFFMNGDTLSFEEKREQLVSRYKLQPFDDVSIIKILNL